jgi:Zn-dependent protease with chaperone function
MNFFRAQDEARGRTTKLVVLLVLAILVLTGTLYVLAVFLTGYHTVPTRSVGVSSLIFDGAHRDWFQPKLFCLTTGLALAVILGGSLMRIAELSKGGGAIAVRLGGRLVSGVTKDPAERRYLNVVQEMALAAGLPVPLCFVLDHDNSINAFAAGNSPQDAAVGITRGALLNLTRDELQGVIAHEFSHIGNGDMKLNLRIIGAIAGLTALAQLGYIFFRLAGSVRGKNSAPIALGMILTGVVVLLIGSGGILFAKVIQAAVSREREYLADASAVQFTRNPLGLGSALKKIAGFSGARREASEAELEAQHLFFASTGGFLESLFSTHPPINERIRRIDPAFDGIIPDVQPVAVSADDASPVSRAAPVASAAPPLPVAASRAVPTDLRFWTRSASADGFPRRCGTLPTTRSARWALCSASCCVAIQLCVRPSCRRLAISPAAKWRAKPRSSSRSSGPCRRDRACPYWIFPCRPYVSSRRSSRIFSGRPSRRSATKPTMASSSCSSRLRCGVIFPARRIRPAAPATLPMPTGSSSRPWSALRANPLKRRHGPIDSALSCLASLDLTQTYCLPRRSISRRSTKPWRSSPDKAFTIVANSSARVAPRCFTTTGPSPPRSRSCAPWGIRSASVLRRG